ncbi:MAG: hypothetical protein IKQ46_11200, partial [Bacteroidales bacterium]|nr:hypothetical protein [Bacteroidales bacterium]
SVNEATLPDINELKEYLGKIYRQAVDTFEIKTDTLTVNGLDKFSHGGSGVLTVYNDDQKTVLRAYDSRMQNGVYYLFFIDNVTDKKDGNGTMVSGYMPRGYNCGFIYDGGSPHTIAHELGHGIAGLEHVFENSKSSGKTKNLMDYSSGEELWHFQWDAIQDPSRVWMKWNKAEEEGENQEPINMYLVEWHPLKNEISGLFIAPSNLPIWIDNVIKVYTLKSSEEHGISLLKADSEAIYGFITAKRDTFIATFTTVGDFIGYYHGDSLYIDKERKTLLNYGMYGCPFYFWDISDSSFVNSYNRYRVHKLPYKYEDWENYCAVLKSTEYFEVKTADEVPCYALYLKYMNSPYMKSHLLKTAIENNPCILHDFVHFNPNMSESEWMRQFRRFVNAGLTVAMLPAVVELLGPIVAEIIVAGGPTVAVATKEEAAVNFGTGAVTESFCSLFVTYVTTENDNWWEKVDLIDVCADAAQAGAQNVIKFTKYKTLYNSGLACFSNVTITDIPKIFNSQDTLIKVITDCGIGAIFEVVFSSKAMTRLMNWVKNLSEEQLIKFFRKKFSFAQPIDEISVISVLGKRPEGWKNEIIRVLNTKEGIAVFNFLKDCNYNYLRLSARNFDRLSQIYSKIGNAERKKLHDLFTEGYDANLLILSIEQFKTAEKKSPSDAVNFVSDVIFKNKTTNKTIDIAGQAKPLENSREKTVTIDGKTYTSEEFMLKYQGDNITYGYLVDKGKQIKIAKFDKRYNFVCELIIEPATKSISTKITTEKERDNIKKFVKEKLLDGESE